MAEDKKKPYTPLYKEVAAAVLKTCGVAALGCFCAMANKADYSGGWVLEISLRDLAAHLGISTNTLKKSLLQPMEAAGFISVESPDRVKTRIILNAMADIESGRGLQSVSKTDTDKKEKTKSVSKIDTDLGALFPEFVVRVGRESIKTEAAKEAQTAQESQSVSKIDTADVGQSVSNYAEVGQNTPLNNPPSSVLFNIYQYGEKANQQKQKNTAPCSLEEVKAFFTQKKFIGSAEDFYYKNEARGWKWYHKDSKTWKKITNWKGTAWEFDKKERLNGAVNWHDPKEPAEKLFKWFYEAVMPESFNNPDARASRWSFEKGNCTHIICVGGSFERGKQIVLYGAEKLENNQFAVSLKAVANNAYAYDDELKKSNGYGEAA